MKNILILNSGFFFLLCLILSCQSQKSMQNIDNIQLQYADGSGNIWKINSKNISYHPVKPEMSSSGIYSGGDEAFKTISETQFLEVYAKFESIFEKKEIHIKDRIMTSGVLSIQEKGKNERLIIFKQGIEMEEIENQLKKCIKP